MCAFYWSEGFAALVDIDIVCFNVKEREKGRGRERER
jgi:hypothetical protein